MKDFSTSIALLFTLITVSGNSFGENEFPVLEGPYLGQKPPSLTPEVFAPDIVWSEHIEGGNAFTPDLKEFYFNRRGGGI